MAKQFTLAKQERLKSRKQTEQVFSLGKRFTLAPFRINYILAPAEKSRLQFGVGVSSKHFKRAVDRNRVKRLIREAYRLQKKKLQDMLNEKNKSLTVFFIYTGKEIPLYQDVFKKMGNCLEKLCTIAEATI